MHNVCYTCSLCLFWGCVCYISVSYCRARLFVSVCEHFCSNNSLVTSPMILFTLEQPNLSSMCIKCWLMNMTGITSKPQALCMQGCVGSKWSTLNTLWQSYQIQTFQYFPKRLLSWTCNIQIRVIQLPFVFLTCLCSAALGGLNDGNAHLGIFHITGNVLSIFISH